MTTPQAHKEWAKFLRDHTRGIATITMYGDDTNATQIPIFTSESQDGFIAATIGLMDIDQSNNPSRELRTELLVKSRRKDLAICNILSTLAFYLLKDRWRANPGTVFENMVSMYLPETVLPHVYFTAPFEWEEWGSVALSDRTIHPLLAIPVSCAEADLAANGMAQELESTWLRGGLDVFDWARVSAA